MQKPTLTIVCMYVDIYNNRLMQYIIYDNILIIIILLEGYYVHALNVNKHYM